jgi:RNA polymerase sigma-70 factor (ECF subfamily)
MEFEQDDLEKFHRKLRFKVFYHLGSFCPEVEDVVQETMTRFLSAIKDGKIRNPESLGAFLSGICNNVICEYRRRLWRDAPEKATLLAPDQPVAPETDLLELRDAIDAGLMQLSDRDRKILRAFFLEERTKEEICLELGLPELQFRVALFRAKERFRKIYNASLKRQATWNH